MDNLTFGLTMTLIGMGGTFLTLALIILMTNLIKRVFPVFETHAGRENRQSEGGRE
jgi:Na+-transporting methylmalonyl-CoA/oxaloacetate decarboxylase gamma subunit